MENKMINEIMLRRKNMVILNDNVTTNTEDNTGRAAIIAKNIEAIGYCMNKELFTVVSQLTVEDQNTFYKEVVGYLKSYVGADKTYNFMYNGFPEQVMVADDWNLFVNAIVHYMSDGTLYPINDKYDNDPRLPLFEDTNLKTLTIGTELDALDLMSNLIGSKTSLSQMDKEDMITLIQMFGLKIDKLPDEIPFKENVSEIGKLIIENTNEITQYTVLSKYFKTATDILRLVVRLNDGDTSLAQNTKFKSMPRKQRKLIISLLDNCGQIEEDMKRYKNQWIKLGEILHIGEKRYSQYTKVQTAFDKLRNNEKAIKSFGGKVNAALENNDVEKAIKILKTRPGELARMLDMLVRGREGVYNQNTTNVISAFAEVATQISVPVLLQVCEHFKYREEKNDSRVFFIKGQLAKAYTIKNELPEIQERYCSDIVNICEKAIIEQFKTKDSMGKVYISDSIKGYCVPQSQRSANSMMKNVTRGSRFSIKEDANFIRLGVHWKNEVVNGSERRTDIDLSCTFLDENFSNLDHVSFTNLRNKYAVHSGDLTNANRATGGASEAIDIYIDKALAAGVRYVAVQVYGYTQTKFCDLDDMIFNWQEGIDENVSDIFDPKRIQQNMNLSGDTDCYIPVLFDLVKREVLWCDMSLTTSMNFPRCVEGNVKGLSATVMGIVQAHKPMMSALATLNALARGSIVSNRDDADIIFDNCLDKPVITVEKIIEVQNENGEVLETKTITETKEKDCKIISAFDLDYWMSEML